MSVFEKAAVETPEPKDELQEYAEKAALGVFENFQEFVDGRSNDFSAYFVLGSDIHDRQREIFMGLISEFYESSTQLPEGALVVTDNVTLMASCNAYIDPDSQIAIPYDITYTATRFDSNL